MARHIEVQYPPTIVANDEEAVEHAEGHRRDGEKIHRSDGFAVILQKREPPFGRFGVPRCSPHPTGNGSLRNLEPEHQKFSVDSRCTPRGILGDHPEDQIANLF